MEITKREIIASITIIAVWICLGFLFAGKIDTWQQDKNAEYDKAARITEEDLFVHGMNTSLGNSFVYGTLEAKDPVTYPEISEKYMYILKIKERYTMHTRVVTYTTGTGENRQTHTRTETYWTWDEVDRENQTTKELIFLGQRFASSKIILPTADYIETIKKSSHIRYKYYGVPEKMTGTLYTRLEKGSISTNSKFWNGMKINEVVEMLEKDYAIIIFWVVWLVMMAIVVAGFYYLDNEWLNG